MKHYPPSPIHGFCQVRFPDNFPIFSYARIVLERKACVVEHQGTGDEAALRPLIVFSLRILIDSQNNKKYKQV